MVATPARREVVGFLESQAVSERRARQSAWFDTVRRHRDRTELVGRGQLLGRRRPWQTIATDSVHDYFGTGRRLRTLNVVDAFTRECHRIEADASLTGERVTRVLDELWWKHGLPKVIDNGPEFISRALDRWGYRHGVSLHFIQPGTPSQNGHVESFNGRFRDECLSLAHFPTLAALFRLRRGLSSENANRAVGN